MIAKRFILNALVATFASAACVAHAAFPEKPIRLVIPFAAGGSTDVVARRFAPKLAEILGQPVVVDNRGGAGGTLASEIVAKAPADGYTLLMTTNSHTANPSIYSKLPYNTQTDFVSVAMVADSPGLLVASTKFAPNNFKEFIDFTRNAKTPVNYGTAGGGTFPHLTMELLKARANLDMVHVPYKGAGPAMSDLLAGVYEVKVDALATAGAHVKAGKIKLYAVTSKERMPQIPDVPTIAELGFPGFESTFWMAILAPAGTPKEAVSTLEQAIIKALNDKEVTERLTADGVRVIAKPGSAATELIERELKQWPPIVKKANIRAD